MSSIAPDGHRLAVTRSNSDDSAIWVFEMKRGTASRLTSPGRQPVWSPEGSRIVFSAIPLKGGPTHHLWTISADGSGTGGAADRKQISVARPRLVPGRGAIALPLDVRGSGDRERTLDDDDAGSRSVPFRNDGFLSARRDIARWPLGRLRLESIGALRDLRREFSDSWKASASVNRRWDTTEMAPRSEGAVTLCRRRVA